MEGVSLLIHTDKQKKSRQTVIEKNGNIQETNGRTGVNAISNLDLASVDLQQEKTCPGTREKNTVKSITNENTQEQDIQERQLVELSFDFDFLRGMVKDYLYPTI